MIVIAWTLAAIMALYWTLSVFVAFRKPTEAEQRLLRELSKEDIERVIDRNLPEDQKQLVERLVDSVEQEATDDIHKMSGSEALGAPYLKIDFWRLLHKRAGWLSALFVGEMLTATATAIRVLNQQHS